MTVIVDASVTVSWLLEDEAAETTAELLRSLVDETILVPAIWAFEVPNVLLQAGKRGRITPEGIAERLVILEALEITVEPPPGFAEFGPLLTLGLETGLSVYDAAYLDLALRQVAPLASLDRRLREAASTQGVPLLPASGL